MLIKTMHLRVAILHGSMVGIGGIQQFVLDTDRMEAVDLCVDMAMILAEPDEKHGEWVNIPLHMEKA